MPRGYWTCQRRQDGVPCRRVNANRYRKCQRCEKPRPKRRPPAHRAILELPYHVFVEAGGMGDVCNVCGVPPKPDARLNRDHSHEGDGFVRGVLCWRHNSGLEMFGDSPELLRAAAAYLERARKRHEEGSEDG